MSNPGPKLLSRGNPQVPEGDGDGPVQTYIAAMPGWKRGFGEHLDRLIVQTVPDMIDDDQLVSWIRQASNLPGENTEPARHA